MTRTIIENGGKVLPATENGGKSQYIITDDGCNNKIWDQLSTGQLVDKLNRKIVHFRWVL